MDFIVSHHRHPLCALIVAVSGLGAVDANLGASGPPLARCGQTGRLMDWRR